MCIGVRSEVVCQSPANCLHSFWRFCACDASTLESVGGVGGDDDRAGCGLDETGLQCVYPNQIPTEPIKTTPITHKVSSARREVCRGVFGSGGRNRSISALLSASASRG